MASPTCRRRRPTTSLRLSLCPQQRRRRAGDRNHPSWPRPALRQRTANQRPVGRLRHQAAQRQPLLGLLPRRLRPLDHSRRRATPRGLIRTSIRRFPSLKRTSGGLRHRHCSVARLHRQRTNPETVACTTPTPPRRPTPATLAGAGLATPKVLAGQASADSTRLRARFRNTAGRSRRRLRLNLRLSKGRLQLPHTPFLWDTTLL